MRGDGGGAGERGAGGAPLQWSPLPTLLLLVRRAGPGVRSGPDFLRVLGGRGAVEDEEDLPDLSDSGDEAAWEDEDDAELPHDKQQTPCLFCDRFVLLGAGAPARPGVPCARILQPVVWSEGLWRRKTPKWY